MAYTRGGGYVFLTRSGEREAVCLEIEINYDYNTYFMHGTTFIFTSHNVIFTHLQQDKVLIICKGTRRYTGLNYI